LGLSSFWQHRDAFQLTVHSSAASTDFHVNHVLDLSQLLAHLVENAAEFPELCPCWYRLANYPQGMRSDGPHQVKAMWPE
jgi:hypothetical protein